MGEEWVSGGSQKATVKWQVPAYWQAAGSERQDCVWGEIGSVLLHHGKFYKLSPSSFLFYSLPHTWHFNILLTDFFLYFISSSYENIQANLLYSIFLLSKSVFSGLIVPFHSDDLLPWLCTDVPWLCSLICTDDLLPWASFIAQIVKNLPATQETWIWVLGQEDALEKEMTTHSSILAWRIPWKEEPGRLQTMRSQESDMT